MTAPMQRAINAGAEALRVLLDDQIEDDDFEVTAICARVAITAAYPHLFQSLSKENRELRARLAALDG